METVGLQQHAPDFVDLPAADGKTYSLSSFAGDRVLAVLFVANGCPSVRALEPWLVDFHETYRSKGVQQLWINSNNASLSPPDTLEEVVQRAERSRLPFPYLKDPGGTVASTFGATNTPHVFVLDERRIVRYRGRVADSRQASAIAVPYLSDAVDDLLAGRDVATPDTEPYGCTIVW